MMRQKGKEVKRQRRKQETFHKMPKIHADAAGIDVGATELWVAVPMDRDDKPVRRFGTFTRDVHALADWLKQCGVKTVAMESTGVYWIPIFQILESRGLQVHLVNARQTKNVTGRKSDWSDCQWVQHLHTLGLLSGSFRPSDPICRLRSYLRHRDNLVKQGCVHVQHMQKAMTQMNIQLHHAISDITGVTGLAILDAILGGERDSIKLAALRDPRVRNSVETIAHALEGDYRAEHLFVLKQSLQAYRFYLSQIRDCDQQIENLFKQLESQADPAQKPPSVKKQQRRTTGHEPAFALSDHLYRVTGVDLTAAPGINATLAQVAISETGLDMSPWPTEKHFSSWLGLCPHHQISGGRVLKRTTRRVVNRAAWAFRMAAYSLQRSTTALGAFYRRMRARKGADKAITATANKLSKIYYRMLRYRCPYVELGENYYQEKYRLQVLKNMRKRAKQLGYQIVPLTQVTAGVS